MDFWKDALANGVGGVITVALIATVAYVWHTPTLLLPLLFLLALGAGCCVGSFATLRYAKPKGRKRTNRGRR
jgi:hypothetical protein